MNMLDVVALVQDLPERGLQWGQVGTMVKELASDVFEVEFSHNNGRTYATLALKTSQFMLLHFSPLDQAS